MPEDTADDFWQTLLFELCISSQDGSDKGHNMFSGQSVLMRGHILFSLRNRKIISELSLFITAPDKRGSEDNGEIIYF